MRHEWNTSAFADMITFASLKSLASFQHPSVGIDQIPIMVGQTGQ